MPEFEMGQRVRVREEGGDPRVQPEQRLLGNEGTVGLAAQVPIGPGGPPTAHYVKLDNGESLLISATWLEPSEAPAE